MGQFSSLCPGGFSTHEGERGFGAWILLIKWKQSVLQRSERATRLESNQIKSGQHTQLPYESGRVYSVHSFRTYIYIRQVELFAFLFLPNLGGLLNAHCVYAVCSDQSDFGFPWVQTEPRPYNVSIGGCGPSMVKCGFGGSFCGRPVRELLHALHVSAGQNYWSSRGVAAILYYFF